MITATVVCKRDGMTYFDNMFKEKQYLESSSI